MTAAVAGRTNRTRVGIVGAGFGRYAIAPAFRRDARCDVVAICARSNASLECAQRELGIRHLFTDVDAMLDSRIVDVVAVATPPAMQARCVQAALDRGLPVFAEKLLATNLNDARSLADAASEQRVPTAIDYIFPELETWSRAQSLLREGAIGVPRHITVSWSMESYDHRHGLATWKTDDAVGGGVLQHFGAHTFNYVEWLMGPVEALSAMLGRAPDITRPGDTSAAVTLKFESGATGVVSLSSASPHGSGHRIEINGSAGRLLLVNPTAATVDGFELELVARGVPTVRLTERRAGGEGDERIAPVARIAARFLDAVRDGSPMAPSFCEGLRVAALLDAVQSSSASAASVSISNS